MTSKPSQVNSTQGKPTQGNSALHQIHRWSIDHPQAVVAFYLGVVLVAVLGSIQFIPRRFAPYIHSPVIAVVTYDAGQNPHDIELKVTNPIEQQLDSIPGVKYIRSSSQPGLSTVTLEFAYGSDMNRMEQLVQDQLPVINSKLPRDDPGLSQPYVVQDDPLNLPILSLALTGTKSDGWTQSQLRQLAGNDIRNTLKRVQGVAAISVFGGERRQLRVTLKPALLTAVHIQVSDVIHAIDSNNILVPAGSIAGQNTELTMQFDGTVMTPAEAAKIPIASFGTPPRVVTIGDVATVQEGVWPRRSSYTAILHPRGAPARVLNAIEIAVTQDPQGSSALIVPQIMRSVAQLEAKYPGIHFSVAYNNSKFVDVLYHNVWDELGVGILLTALAVLLFLGDLQATAITLFTLPIGMAAAIALFLPFHLTFNSGSLIGLLLAVGRMVDDTIIDIHSVQRHLKMGMSIRDATIDGIADVRKAVIASTVMIVIALTPLLFAGGLVQAMFTELVWPLIFGLLASLLVSLTLTPVLCVAFLKRSSEAENTVPTWLRPVQSKINKLENAYEKSVLWCLKNRFANVIRIGATLVIGLTLFSFIGSEMMPLSDTGQAYGSLEMAPGTSFLATKRAVQQLEKIIVKHRNVLAASIEVGEEPMMESFNPVVTGYQMPQADSASLMLTLTDKDRRSHTIWNVIDSIQREAMASIPGLRKLQIKEMGSDVMASPDSPVTIDAYGPNLAVLNQIGHGMMQAARKMPNILYQPARSWQLGVPQYSIKVHKVQALQAGLTPQFIASQLNDDLRGSPTLSPFYHESIRQDLILIRGTTPSDKSPNQLLNLPILRPDGTEVPLGAVATLIQTAAPTEIQHDGLRRIVQLSAFYRKGHPASMDSIMDWIRNSFGGNKRLGISAVNFPPGYGILVRGDMTQMMASMRRLSFSLLISLALMYLVLTVQFRSFLAPLQMIASLPLELTGAFAALCLAHEAFSTVSLFGIIVLTGMDITTAILMIDLIGKSKSASASRLREDGQDSTFSKEARDSAVAAACKARLRPILMTSIITLVVLLPVAIHPKTGLDAYQPLATAVVGGLIVGTFLSLFDIPILNTLVEDGIRYLGHFRTKSQPSSSNQVQLVEE